MSDSPGDGKIPSNEEIVDDLMKSFKTSVSTEDEFVINPDSKAEQAPLATNLKYERDVPGANTPTTEPITDSDFDKDNEEKDKEDSDTDTIDEEHLKDAEIDLTDDQKAERKLIAEELKSVGNDAFKLGDFDRCIEKYTEGLKICPLQFSQLRSVLFCNRSAGFMKQEKYAKAIKDCTKAIDLDEKYLKAYIRRAQSYEATEKFDESLADFKKILDLDPSHAEARKAAHRLPPLIDEKNEKLKTEMLGKLKDLGNMILKPFGLSTENFQMEQDPESKGYKINFKQ